MLFIWILCSWISLFQNNSTESSTALRIFLVMTVAFKSQDRGPRLNQPSEALRFSPQQLALLRFNLIKIFIKYRKQSKTHHSKPFRVCSVFCVKSVDRQLNSRKNLTCFSKKSWKQFVAQIIFQLQTAQPTTTVLNLNRFFLIWCDTPHSYIVRHVINCVVLSFKP